MSCRCLARTEAGAEEAAAVIGALDPLTWRPFNMLLADARRAYRIAFH
ncbi:MAG: hypothetical protein U1E38_05200 [Rhodospirillales bacterium]